MLLAMRLFKPGDIRVGRMWDARPAAFNLTSGRSSSGRTDWNPGKQYRMDNSEIESIRALYSLLGRIKLRDQLRGIALSLRRFSSIYDRSLHQGEDRLVDAIVALEALLPTGAELAFKLATRVAGLLGEDDDARVQYSKIMKQYYRTRNNIVHGSSLKAKDSELIRNDEPLRSIVRRLLVGFLNLAESPDVSLTRKFYDEQLDADLLHSRRRDNLRKAMKLA